MRRILILGGTAEARQLGSRLAHRADLSVTLSLAGRTAAPAAQSVPVRVGGFGGVDGLVRYLRQECVDALIDATHPYAAAISAHAAAAASETGIPLVALHRAPWRPIAGDRWMEVEDTRAAVTALGATPRRVFLALGRQELDPFSGAPQHHYLVRSVDPIKPPLAVPHATYITGRGPFSEKDDHQLLGTHRIETMVAKNSGGTATYGKIAAARALGIPVVMLRRPARVPAPTVDTIEAAVAWLDHEQAPSAARGV